LKKRQKDKRIPEKKKKTHPRGWEEGKKIDDGLKGGRISELRRTWEIPKREAQLSGALGQNPQQR